MAYGGTLYEKHKKFGEGALPPGVQERQGTSGFFVVDPRTGKAVIFNDASEAGRFYNEAESAMKFGDRQLQEGARQFNEKFNFDQNAYYTGMADRAEGYKRETSEIQSGYGEMLDAWSKNTGQRAADIRSAYHDKEASGMQALARTGMANTTIAPTMKLGYEREAQEALNRDADANLNTKLGILGGRTTSLASAQTRYTGGATRPVEKHGMQGMSEASNPTLYR